MNKAADFLASFFDGGMLAAAQGYSNLFASWGPLVAARFPPRAGDEPQTGDKLAAHSRIVELERGILLVEADHPGWIQILQTKQRELLGAMQKRFPSLAIQGISFRLSRKTREDNDNALGKERV